VAQPLVEDEIVDLAAALHRAIQFSGDI
jgi:hypothetical protein